MSVCGMRMRIRINVYKLIFMRRSEGTHNMSMFSAKHECTFTTIHAPSAGDGDGAEVEEEALSSTSQSQSESQQSRKDAKRTYRK